MNLYRLVFIVLVAQTKPMCFDKVEVFKDFIQEVLTRRLALK